MTEHDPSRPVPPAADPTTPAAGGASAADDDPTRAIPDPDAPTSSVPDPAAPTYSDAPTSAIPDPSPSAGPAGGPSAGPDDRTAAFAGATAAAAGRPDDPTAAFAGATAAGAGRPDDPTAAFPGGAGSGGPQDATAGGGSAGATAAGATAAGAPPPGWGGPAGYGVRRLQRSRQRRVIGGVAGGLGEYTGIDPVLFRVLFAVLTVFGGAGILLYVLGWLFVPDQDRPVSPAESLLGRGTSAPRPAEAAQGIGLAVAALVLAAVLLRGDAGDLVLVGVLVVGGILLARHLDDRRADGLPPRQPPPPAPAGPPPAYQPYQAYSFAGGPGQATATAPPPAYAPPPVFVPPRPRPPRQRSILSLATMSVLLIGLGVLAAIDLASGDESLQPRHYLAVALGAIGLGLVVGAFRGRARGLIWVGVPLTFVLLGVSAAEGRFDGGTGDRTYRPLSVAELQGDYELGVGDLELDLTGVDFAEQQVTTRVHVGIGGLHVTVPENVDVRVRGRAGLGEVILFGQTTSGTSNDQTVSDDGADGDGGGDLELVLDTGIGQVEVDRA